MRSLGGRCFYPPGPAAAGLVAGTGPRPQEGSKEPAETRRGRPGPESSGELGALVPAPG